MCFVPTCPAASSSDGAALARMDEGTYGTCAECGEEIPEARLEARPLSVTCVSCAAKAH